jgi:hypothetical protein
MIGQRLIPVMARSRHLPLMIGVVAAASTLLEAAPAELWILPVALLARPALRAPLVFFAAFLLATLLSLYAIGATLGDSATVPFLLELSGLKGIHDYQKAREAFGVWIPLFAGGVGPSTRDVALMAGHRGFPGAAIALPLFGLHVLCRAALLGLFVRVLRRGGPLVRIAGDYTLFWWILLIVYSAIG